MSSRWQQRHRIVSCSHDGTRKDVLECEAQNILNGSDYMQTTTDDQSGQLLHPELETCLPKEREG